MHLGFNVRDKLKELESVSRGLTLTQDQTFKHRDRKHSARGSQQCEKDHTLAWYLLKSECPQPTLLRLRICVPADIGGVSKMTSYHPHIWHKFLPGKSFGVVESTCAIKEVTGSVICV